MEKTHDCIWKKVALNIKWCVVKVAKCKQRGILTSIRNTYSLKVYHFPTEPKMQNIVWVSSKWVCFSETVTRYQK
jgi:hypothetical protein